MGLKCSSMKRSSISPPSYEETIEKNVQPHLPNLYRRPFSIEERIIFDLEEDISPPSYEKTVKIYVLPSYEESIQLHVYPPSYEQFILPHNREEVLFSRNVSHRRRHNNVGNAASAGTMSTIGSILSILR